MGEAFDPTVLRKLAMDLLARREHSRLELGEKLRRHCGRRASATEAEAPAGATDVLVERTLDELEADGLQSDARYAEVLIRSRVNRGQGPLRIKADLRQRGINGDVANPLLEEYAEQWPELAQQVVARRFGDEAMGDRREWARRARFLAGRGFPESMVARVLGPLP